MTLALECGLLTPSVVLDSFADESWYGDHCIVHTGSLV